MTDKENHKSLSLSDIGEALGLPPTTNCAEWYLQSNRTIPWPESRHFDPNNPTGKHPVLLLDHYIRKEHHPDTPYPCWIRSSSIPSLIQHLKHSHLNKTCSINALGWMVTETTVPITKQDLQNYFCDEPEDSQLLKQLRKHSNSLNNQLRSFS